MAKKAKPPEEAGESAPMWIVSFADLVTLMMSFFVVLYALKSGGKETEVSVSAAIAAQFGHEFPMDPNDPYAVAAWKTKGVDLIANQGRASQHIKGAEGKDPEVRTIRDARQTPTSGGSILFAFGKAELDADSRETIGKLVPILQGHSYVLLVKGHVSGDEIATRPDDPEGTSLSTRRAMVVVEELASRGIERRLLRPVSCGPYEPLTVGVYDAASLANNRRVEVFTTDTSIAEFAPLLTVPAETNPKKSPAATQPAE